jgi:hypothetical protein
MKNTNITHSWTCEVGVTLAALYIQSEPKVTVRPHYRRKPRFILSINIHKLAQQTGVSYGGTRTVLKHLHLHPYKIMSVQELKERDNTKRPEYCLWSRDLITANGRDNLDVTFLIDEVWFHLSGYANNQNSDVGPATNPYEIKVGV